MRLTPKQIEQLRAAPGSNRLDVAMELASATQESVAQALQISQPKVSRLASGPGDMKLSMARKLAGLFGCTVDDLFPHRSARRAADTASVGAL